MLKQELTSAEDLGLSDTGELEDLRTLNGAGADDDLLVGGLQVRIGSQNQTWQTF